MKCVVNDSCIKCEMCVGFCPVVAFHEDDYMLVINPDVCIGCDACIIECPYSAITREDEADVKWLKYNAEKSKILPLCC